MGELYRPHRGLDLHEQPHGLEADVQVAHDLPSFQRPHPRVGASTFYHVIIVRQNTVQLMTAGVGPCNQPDTRE
jgi:hypothetical protein